VSDNKASTEEKPPKRSTSWGSLLLSALLGIIVTVVGALIVGRLQSREPNLLFASTESVPFNGPNNFVSIYQVTFSNDGKKEVDDVACVIRIPAAKVDQFKVSANPSLVVSGTASGDALRIQIPSLNPSEAVQVSLLASGSQSLPLRPEVSARGRGVTGAEKTQTNESPLSGASFFFMLIGVASSAVVTTGLFSRLLRKKNIASGTTGSEADKVKTGAEEHDQRQVLAYICRVSGLNELADQYSSEDRATSYWAEADRLGQIAAESGDPQTVKAIEYALLALTEYVGNIVESSLAIIFYNVARIKKVRGDEDGFAKFLELAKKTSRNIIESRLKIDHRFGAT
jgi:hypothetical protein